VHQAQIGIRSPDFRSELGLNAGRLGSGQSGLAGAEPHQGQLVFLAALDLQGSPARPVRYNRIADLAQVNGTAEPGRVDGGKALYQLTKESLQVHAAFSRLGSGRRKCLQCS